MSDPWCEFVCYYHLKNEIVDTKVDVACGSVHGGRGLMDDGRVAVYCDRGQGN